MKNQYKFKNFNYNVNHNIVTNRIIELAVGEFNDDVLKTIDPKQKLVILFKMKTLDGEWRSISPFQIVDSRDIQHLKDVLCDYWSYKTDVYHNLLWSNIVFRYRLLEKDIAPKDSVWNYPVEFDKKPSLLPEGYKNIPNNRLFELWGEDILILDSNTYKVSKGDHSYLINKIENEYFITLFYKETKMLYFHDIYEDNIKTNTFIREIGNLELYFHNGECNFLMQSIKTRYIQIKNPDLSIKDNFITMDFETRTLGNEMHVISISIFDGKIIKSFYLHDFKSSDLLIKEGIMYLLQRKYLGYRVYFHNFSNFDAIFLIKHLAQFDICKIERCIKRDNKIIEIKVNYNLEGNRKYSIYFRDSLLILPSSLKKLGNSFNVEIKKTLYPYKFVNNINVNLDYEGKVPGIEFFDNITEEDYKNYSKAFDNKIWSLREETIKYCENDVISLYLILKEFQKMIFRLFETDINNYPTLSSLAFAIYRIKYLKNFKIPVIVGEVYRDLKESYTGGSVDVFIPTGKNVNRYDVNSLYPSVMSDFPSPVGKIKKFKGDIFKYKENPFGFFFVKVKAPEYTHIPILQTRVRTTKSGIRTISPLGEWTGFYFSEEILNAKKYGYKFEVIWGYTFEKEYIFKEYVNDLYEIKKNSAKNTSMYTISKLLLNALYGRFGMSPDKESHEIVKGIHAISHFISQKNIKCIDSLELGEDIELISYTKNREFEEDMLTNNISVAVASSITAYARIKMSEIKTKYSDNIYYSDTDSIDLDVELPNKYISNNLGDYKLESKFKEVIYIAPKVYAAVKDNGEEYVIVKGYKDEDISFSEMSILLNKGNKLQLEQEKWYKNMSEGKILTKMEKYTLIATENKRKLIYENNKLVKSVPYTLKDGKLI